MNSDAGSSRVCAVCLDDFEDARLLPCLHSLCRVCIDRQAVTESGRRLRCPICRTWCKLPKLKREQPVSRRTHSVQVAAPGAFCVRMKRSLLKFLLPLPLFRLGSARRALSFCATSMPSCTWTLIRATRLGTHRLFHLQGKRPLPSVLHMVTS